MQYRNHNPNAKHPERYTEDHRGIDPIAVKHHRLNQHGIVIVRLHNRLFIKWDQPANNIHAGWYKFSQLIPKTPTL